MRNFTIRFFAVIGALLLLTLPAQAARLALVIGNDAYRQIEPLKNARNDARLMAATLKEAGFEVERVFENLDRKDMLRAINGFKARITKADDVVFFYAGHGIQIGRESPVLLPIDITQENDDQIVQDGVQLSTVQNALVGAGFALLVIDACRDNPFPRKSDGTRGLARQTGLELIQQPLVGSMVVMSAGTGEKALDYVPDGTRGNGLFTYEFVQAIRSPGKPLILAISEVKARVTAKAQRMGNSQRPTYLDESSGGGFVFFTAQPPVTVPGPIAPTVVLSTEQEVEQKLWNVIERSNDVQDFQDYLKRYPNGRFAPLAQRQLRVLNARQQPVPQVQQVAQPSKPRERAFAYVNDVSVPLARIETLEQQMVRSGKAVTPEMKVQIKEEVIAREIFMQEARKIGLDEREEFNAQMELARQTILIRDLFANYGKSNPTSENEVRAEYDKFVAASSGSEYKARHILVEQEATANAIIAQIKRGARFDNIAKRESKDPGSAAKGGDLDWANPSSYVAEFSNALKRLSKGGMTDVPVKTQFGYHIIRLDDVREVQPIAFETAKQKLIEQLKQQKLTKYQDGLRSKAKVTYPALGTNDGVIAFVNGIAVAIARLEALEQQVAQSGRSLTPEIKVQIKEEVIAREIFMQEARKIGLDEREEFNAQMELARQTILIRDLFANYGKSNPTSDNEVRAEYDKVVAASNGSEYKARHILVEQEATANAIIAQLKRGSRFDDIAKRDSKDPGSAAKGGDLDWANSSSYVTEFSNALKRLSKGGMTDVPVKTQFGYHIIRLDDVRVANVPTLDSVKTQIVEQLKQQKMSKYQESLRAKAKVVHVD